MKEGEIVTLNENDNLLVKGIQNNPYAIGYFGYAYYLENKNTLKVLGIDNGEGEPVKTKMVILSKRNVPTIVKTTIHLCQCRISRKATSVWLCEIHFK